MQGKVRIIPATRTGFSSVPLSAKKKRRVAAYARVSTEEDMQQTSYEAQVRYYSDYIRNNPEWEFVEVYADEGISGTHTKKREGFLRMVDDAVKHKKIDLILTKSVSRFARNTVDSLSTIRLLKDNGVEVYFEKENIWTFDSKGEMLLTIMSSIAQEESRSISENVLWGVRKRYEVGQYTLPYKVFLGYDRGPDGKPVINAEQARTVRYIFRRFLEGKTPHGIATELKELGWKTGTGRTCWNRNDILRILKNEKYAGHILLQKSFKKDLLSERQANMGEVRSFFIEDDHEAIVSQEEFDMVQRELERRKDLGRNHNSTGLFSSQLICGDCGSFYGAKVWHSTDKYRRVVWQCNGKYHGDKKCTTPHLTDDQVKDLFLRALNQILVDKESTVNDLESVRRKVLDVEKLEKDLAFAELEFDRVSKDFNDYVSGHAITEADITDGVFAELERKYSDFRKRTEKLRGDIADRRRRGAAIGRFIDEMKSWDEPFQEFTDDLWYGLGDSILIKDKKNAVVKFKSGLEISVSINR